MGNALTEFSARVTVGSPGLVAQILRALASGDTDMPLDSVGINAERLGYFSLTVAIHLAQGENFTAELGYIGERRGQELQFGGRRIFVDLTERIGCVRGRLPPERQNCV